MYRNLADSEAVRTALRIRARAGGVDGGDVGGGGGSLSSDPGAGSSPSDAEWDRRDVVTRVLLPLLTSLADADAVLDSAAPPAPAPPSGAV